MASFEDSAMLLPLRAGAEPVIPSLVPNNLITICENKVAFAFDRFIYIADTLDKKSPLQVVPISCSDTVFGLHRLVTPQRGAGSNEFVVALGAAWIQVIETEEMQNAFMYKFFDGSACELSENMVGALGWRKLLAFSAAIVNIGGGAVQLGNPYNASNPFVINRQYEWSSCHNHWHFNHVRGCPLSALPLPPCTNCPAFFGHTPHRSTATLGTTRHPGPSEHFA